MIKIFDRKKREDDPNECFVKVLGSGCKKCKALEKNARKAFSSMGIDAEIGHVTEMESIVSYGVMQTPCLVFGKEVVSVGEVLSADRIKELIEVHREDFE